MVLAIGRPNLGSNPEVPLAHEPLADNFAVSRETTTTPIEDHDSDDIGYYFNPASHGDDVPGDIVNSYFDNTQVFSSAFDPPNYHDDTTVTMPCYRGPLRPFASALGGNAHEDDDNITVIEEEMQTALIPLEDEQAKTKCELSFSSAERADWKLLISGLEVTRANVGSEVTCHAGATNPPERQNINSSLMQTEVVPDGIDDG
ncbi:hypothetical protein [Mesorhizobium sp. GbtcB19]|uniref:hypothetical protein n=1 Tax=Mesorhizobium sp. GbtcB19 TaxID=2824764 RepID=UPI001C306270|nr:hypothetical protein [Mesorhizobium sp. GbtcB19]